MVAVEGSLWSFSLRVYQAPGVADACLELQDSRGLDVNVLLMCAWAGVSRGELGSALVAEAEALSRDWSGRVVQGLRSARRGLASSGYEELRADVQRVELAAEKVEQERLEEIALRAPARELGSAEAGRSAAANLACYLETTGVASDPQVETLLATLVDAALGDGRRPG